MTSSSRCVTKESVLRGRPKIETARRLDGKNEQRPIADSPSPFVRLQILHEVLLQRLNINDLDQAFAEVLAQVDSGLRFRDRAHALRDGNRIDQCPLTKLRRQRPQTDLIDRQLCREVGYAPRQRLCPLLLVVTVPVQVGGIVAGGKPLHAVPSSSPARV